ERKLAALKLNGNFPGNPARGLPTIQGVILLCDADTGAVLAIMDSIEITLRRTAAATALAAKHLARRDADLLAVIGCGAQARAQVEALADVLPLKRGVAFDLDADRARDFAAEARSILPFEATHSLQDATRRAQVIVTCTTARAPFLDAPDVSPGAFIAAVGADNPEKSEIAPALMAKAAVVADVLAQCLVMGDLHHAVKAGAMTADQVRAELGEIIVGAKSGRAHDDEIVIFDSTGTAIQDVASAAVVYERARERGIGAEVELA
ncbi:MAG TPA: ornithine cyclodeaminase family protein, partial [Vitreimonas sp.]|nr:ornithine cyclodeaminase family protein [Vitreimonas sp.]